MKLVIVGGVAGGASAAARARRLDEHAEIVLLERGPDVSFANCGLPYYLSGDITDRQKLLIVTPERMKERYRLDVRTRAQVESIDRSRKIIQIRDLTNDRTYEETYDRLILSPGAAPIRPSLPGIDHEVIHTLRNLEDMDRIKRKMHAGIRQAVIIGAGFIGIEMAEAIVLQGLSTTVVELQKQILPPFDQEMTTPLEKALREKNISLLLGDSVTRIETAAKETVEVVLQSGRRLPAQLVILSIGVKPENTLARQAGLEIGPRGGIRVNPQMQTSDPDIYAVGDAVETQDAFTAAPIQVPLAGPANRQGRLAADHALGRSIAFRGIQGTAILKVFEKTAAITGATEKTLQQRRQAYCSVVVHAAHHAGYYPGAELLSLKLTFEPKTGKLLGAQAVGGSGVDKRIDVLSVALQAGMNVYDLEEMELSYAPPYGSAKDPVNMAGFVAAGLLRGDHPQMTVAEWLALDSDKRPVVLDVRTASEHASGHISGAIHIPIDELRSRFSEIPAEREILTYCQVGMRGYLATRILLARGYQVKNLSGGWKSFEMFSKEQPL